MRVHTGRAVVHCLLSGTPEFVNDSGVFAVWAKPAARPCSNMNWIPCASNALRMASRLFAIGTLLPFSKSRTVLSETRARSGQVSRDQFEPAARSSALLGRHECHMGRSAFCVKANDYR